MPAPNRASSHAGEFGPDSYRGWRATSLGSITEDLQRRLILNFAGALPGRSVLDIGCGDGGLTRALRQGGAGTVVGCDPDRRMIDTAVAGDAARSTAPEGAIGYLVGRAEMLPFPDCSFDIVTIITVLAFIPEPRRAVREIARVLRPGGRLVVGDLGKWSIWAALRLIRARLGASMWRAARFRSASELRTLVEEAGLRVEEVAGAVYYPRCAMMARLMAPFDRVLGGLTTFGAAFVAVAAGKR
jgi:ubiquinone/menaquinone biosynthesis C-methylase UbiE